MNRAQKIAQLRAARKAYRRTAARVRYLDEAGRYGEMDMTSIRAGDLVKFEAEFIKRADDEHDDTTKTVAAGEVGEVIDVLNDVPGLLVEVPCMLNSMDGAIIGESEMFIEPQTVVVLVDARDTRIGDHRMATRYAMWWPLIEMAMGASGPLYPGKKEFSVENQRHIVWALETLAEGIRETLPEHEVDYEDDDAELDDLAQALDRTVEIIGKSTTKNWPEQLAFLKESADYFDFYQTYPGARLILQNPTGYSELALEPPEGWEGHRQRELQTEYGDPGMTPDMSEWMPFEVGQAPLSYDEPEDVEEISSEEVAKEWEWGDSGLSGRLPEPEELPERDVEVDEELKGTPDQPAAESPSKYDVSMVDFGEEHEPSSPHGWADTEVHAPDVGDESAASIPIPTYSGFQGGKKVWVEPDMHVRNIRTKQEAIVVSLATDDHIIVQPINRKSGEPQGQPEQWDAGREVKLSKLHQFPVQALSHAEMEKWRIDRKVRLQRQKREDQQERRGPFSARAGRFWGPMSRMTVVTAESLTLS